MKTVGIICEYNPLHLGHQKQFRMIRQAFGEQTAIVCLMSGNYVQRGAPAVFDKSVRAKAAILAGANLVLELPVGAALSSAEGFADGGVRILGRCCDTLCFGTESMDNAALAETAEALLSDTFSEYLKEELSSGCSFPTARQRVLSRLNIRRQLDTPNDILGVEYTKAIARQHSNLEIFPIHREGGYHSETLDCANPSATAVRNNLIFGKEWISAVPPETVQLFRDARCHTLKAAERAILLRLRSLPDEAFEALPYGSEGLWRKLMKASRSEPTLDAIAESTKSKRYTRTRIDRMILCAFLGLTQTDIRTEVPYVRVLAFDECGQEVLKVHKKEGLFRNCGEAMEDPYWSVERRCGDLYGLFCVDEIEAPGIEEHRRVYVHREET